MKRLVQLGCIGMLASATVLGGRAQELSPGPPTLPAGLVRARADIGQNILGASNFFSINPGPPDAPSLEVWLNDTSNVAVHVNIFDTNPGPPTTWLRMTIVNGVVVLQQDRAIGNADIVPEYGADLGAFTPPSPIVDINPGPPDFPGGLARAMGEIGQSLLGASKFFSVKLSPGPPNTPSLDLWLDDTANVPVAINVFVRLNPGPPNTWLRVTIQNGAVLVQQATTVGKPDVRVDYSADLSAYVSPSPVTPR